MSTLYETIGQIFDPSAMMAGVAVAIQAPREVIDVECEDVEE